MARTETKRRPAGSGLDCLCIETGESLSMEECELAISRTEDAFILGLYFLISL